MQTYKAPLRDMRFVLHELPVGPAVSSLPGLEECTSELMDSVLEEAAKVAEGVLLPVNASGDEEGCHYENGVVRTPKGFKEAYTAFREGGWTGIAADPEYGGQGLPESLNKLVEEMSCSANLSFSLYPGLTHGAYQAIYDHATDELKQTYLPKMVDGTWSGTMCLTEAHCGTDLGLMRTKATPDGNGSYRITGSKIFISAGEHDLTENIIHLVLAKLPNAPPGIKGVSLFLVPKFLPGEDGRPGQRNGVVCTGIEHKMGIKASATCQLSFDDAVGWLVGEPNKGMRAMFTMMNSERLSVGVQGLGAAEASYQGAVAYARDRIQGRSLSGAMHKDKAADPIIVHPDVRRMLLTIRSYTEGCRALGAWVARELDVLAHSDDPAAKQGAEDFAALMTPVVKALFTDLGFEAASIAMQVYGGHGYIRDHGMEQYVRDARISMIYEGTNGIQALDLVGRKLPQNAGRLLRGFFHPVSEFIASNEGHAQLGKLVKALAKSFEALQGATAHIAQTGLADPEQAGAAATEYLRLFGLVALGYMWARNGARRSGEAAPRQRCSQRRRRLLSGEAPRRAVLHGAHPAAGVSTPHQHQGRQAQHDAVRRGRVLAMAREPTLIETPATSGSWSPRPHTRRTSMTPRHTILAVLGSIVLVAGCAVPPARVADRENLLASAGFVARPADTPEKQKLLHSISADRFVRRSAANRSVFLFADPLICNCVYIGDQAAYDRYRQEVRARNIADDKALAVQDSIEPYNYDFSAAYGPL